MHRIDGAGATVDNRFTEGDPQGGTPATVVTAAWLNSVQEELAGLIEAAGIDLDKEDNAQLRTAIQAIVPSKSVLRFSVPGVGRDLPEVLRVPIGLTGKIIAIGFVHDGAGTMTVGFDLIHNGAATTGPTLANVSSSGNSATIDVDVSSALDSILIKTSATSGEVLNPRGFAIIQEG